MELVVGPHRGGAMEQDMTPITIDVEASGFGRGSYPVEIGLALPDGTRHCFLIAPAHGWTHWDEEAAAIHGISRERLQGHGLPVHDVASQLNALLHGKTAYSDAWSFDMSWIGKLFDAADQLQGFRVADISELMDEAQHGQWQAVKRQVMGDLGLKRHRASGDARVLQETWLRVSRPA